MWIYTVSLVVIASTSVCVNSLTQTNTKSTAFSYCMQAVYHHTCSNEWKNTKSISDFKQTMITRGNHVWMIRFDGVPLGMVETELVRWMKNAKLYRRSLSLSFSNTPFHDKNKTLATFSKLETLVLKNNGLKNNIGFSLNPELRDLSIVENELTSIPFKRIGKSLRRANFANNRITSISNTFFKDRSITTYSLNLENNKIRELPSKSLFNINYIFLGGNQIKDFSSTVFNKVYRLELQGNLLTSLKVSMFNGLIPQYINVSNNQIHTIDKDFFLKITKDLLEIDLSYNKLSMLPVIDASLLPSLKVVRLDGNNLTSLDGVFLGKFSYLKTLSISDLGLKNISEIPFYRMPELRKLDLSNNSLLELDEFTFSNNFNLKDITMETTKSFDGNGTEQSSPVFCSCEKNPRNMTLRCNPNENRSNYNSHFISSTIVIGEAICTVSFISDIDGPWSQEKK